MKLKAIAERVGGALDGDPSVEIAGVSGVENASAGDITFVAAEKFFAFAATTNASAVLVPRDFDAAAAPGRNLVRCDNPEYAFNVVIDLLRKKYAPPPGVSANAAVAAGVVLGTDVSVGHFAVIEEGASVGDGTVIYPNACIGRGVRIGAGCIIYQNVTVREETEIGNNCIIQPGAVIGADGFGYAQVDGRHVKLPQIGNVVLEDDVEIGACTTIDRARFDTTVIGRGTKIDNLVQIAHNVTTGEHCIIVSQTGISGSVKIGGNVIFGGQAGIGGHLEIGDKAVVSARGGVTKSVKPGAVIMGRFGETREKELANRHNVNKIPAIRKELRELEKRVNDIEENAKNG